MGLLDGKFVVLGVSGGIAAYRACELARLLVKDGAQLQVVLTSAAAEMIGSVTFQALSGRPAEVGQGGSLAVSGMPHIDLGRDADLIIVAPATANSLAKFAAGLADNLLSATVLASTCPVVLAPAMNTRMWENRITQANVSLLNQLERMIFVGPASGSLACGEEGAGRMEDPVFLLEAVRAVLSKNDLEGRKVLVTAGPTREPVDPVRSLTNRSSGKMGYALAAAARRRGAKVVLVSGPTALTPPWGVKLVEVETAAQMAQAVDKNISQCNLVLMAAAVADFKPKTRAKQKIKKGRALGVIELSRTKDILAALGKKKKKPLLVGFAAETGDPVKAARQKLKAKRLDLMVANDVSLPDAGFDVDTNRVHLVDGQASQELPLLSKEEVAERILDRVVKMLPKKRKT
ncbi:MAG: bifunctional phosphopantothenoylcysteine decarboxylase/phosphopantothenate--cysteine ligase CoaBC [Deltaproteobacteria bacterium]|nr:bifunctional phosphopantothenoylcysteine decarboxylase/phosphopantothenate--cysteine ligase CoaBC [Deltaproteobacteria bacterium]